MEVFYLIPLCALCFFGAHYYRLQKKTYETKSREVNAIVVSWQKYKKDMGKYKETWYCLEVQTSDGQMYRIETPNRKARKYKENNYIVILVPMVTLEKYAEDKYDLPVIIKEDKKSTVGIVILILFGVGFTVFTILDIIAHFLGLMGKL